jgi:peptide/nickel transport system substrate-binding protein
MEEKMTKNKWMVAWMTIIIASMLVSACAPERVVETVVVTQIVEKEGQTVIETQIVEVTPTPEPEAPAEALAKVSPEFKNPDTYVVVGGAGEPETLDPAWTYETAGSATEANIYEGLVWYDREKYDEFIPALATDWTVSDDGLTWVFNIRPGVTFHEGGTLEAHDVVYTNLRAMLQGRIDGPQWILYEAFFGTDLALASSKSFAAAYIGKENFEDLTPAELVKVCEDMKERVVADDAAGTLTYHLAKPTPWLLAISATNFLGDVLDSEWMIENGDWDNDCATWQNFADPAAQDTILFDRANGTGPYKLDHWIPGEEIVLVANENYWRTEPMWEGGPSGVAQIKRVVIKDIPEWGTRLAMLEAGDADFIYTPPVYRSQLEPYAQTFCDAEENCQPANPDGYLTIYRDLPQPAMTPAQLNWNINVEGGNPYIGSGALDGNGTPPNFFSDIHVRKAFSYCFDYEAMIRDSLNGEGIQAQGPILKGMLGYREGEAPLYSYDPAKCEEEFKLADVDLDGIPAGEDEDDVWSNGFYMQIAYNTGNDTRRLSSEILEAGVEAVNPAFNIEVVGMPFPVLLESRRSGKLPVYVGGWLEDFHDPHNWVQPFLFSAGAYGRVINMPPEIAAKYDELILQAANLTDQDARAEIYKQLQLMSQEDAVVVWMYQVLNRVHLQPWIKGYYYNPAYTQDSYTWIYALSKVAP